MKLKTLEDIDIFDLLAQPMTIDSAEKAQEIAQKRMKNKLRKEAIKWIKEIKRKQDEHWTELGKDGFITMKTPYEWELEGLTFQDWHEASDPDGAIMILKHFLNIKDSDL